MSVIQDYLGIFLFLVAGFGFVAFGMFVSKLLRPHKPNQEKNTTYESGEDPSQNAWGNFNIRFYLVGLIFIIFEAEIIFLFPWATVFTDKQLMLQTNGWWAFAGFFEVLVFMLVLILGLAYVWAKGYLDWDKPQTENKTVKEVIPKELYKNVNKKYS